MGMAASQARFLSLTARKTNVEYEGQQINQQRTTLSNESSNYYSRLCNLNVPTPPSSEDFTKTTYTFEDGAEKNTINTIIAKGDGMYLINYTQSFQTENVIAKGPAVVTRGPVPLDENGQPIAGAEREYFVGANKLRVLNNSTTNYTSANQAYFKDDKYLMSLYNEGKLDEIDKILLLEQEYYSRLNDKYVGVGLNPEDWFVRYELNTNTNNYEPVFYNKDQIVSADYNDKTGSSISGIKSYVYGQTMETKEVRNAKARVQQDVNGRYISVFIYELDASGNPTDKGTEYVLTATTQADDRAYNDAMNQYSYEKAQYDQEVQAINAKIEIIQAQDKDLELRLKQLDTEENAISTEMEAVKKVISKNVESSFKTFNA